MMLQRKKNGYKTVRIILSLIYILISSAFHWISGQDIDTLSRIDALFLHYDNNTPGVAVAIARKGEMLYNKSFGMADLEHDVPVTTETIFECGSVSKQFTAASILLLAQDGLLSLNDDIRKYIPELPDYQDIISINDLLGHTSGLKDWGEIYSLAGWPRTTRVYTQELSRNIIFKQKNLNFKPGTRFLYSNSNYVLLTLIAERVSGVLLDEFSRNRLFIPLGMKNTRWRSNFRETVKARAVAYSGNNDSFQQMMPFENVYGPGGLLTTTADLLLWNRLLVTNELFNINYADLRIKPHILDNGESTGYAAGLYIKDRDGFREISHSGATAGYRAYLGYFPEKQLSIALLSNDASFATNLTGYKIASIFLGTDATPPLPVEVTETSYEIPAEILCNYEGTYKSEEADATFRLTAVEGSIMILRKPGDTLFLRPIEKDLFVSDNMKYKFQRNHHDRIKGFSVSGSRAYNIPFEKL